VVVYRSAVSAGTFDWPHHVLEYDQLVVTSASVAFDAVRPVSDGGAIAAVGSWGLSSVLLLPNCTYDGSFSGPVGPAPAGAAPLIAVTPTYSPTRSSERNG
jgi:hypothetical protein